MTFIEGYVFVYLGSLGSVEVAQRSSGAIVAGPRGFSWNFSAEFFELVFLKGVGGVKIFGYLGFLGRRRVDMGSSVRGGYLGCLGIFPSSFEGTPTCTHAGIYIK